MIDAHGPHADGYGHDTFSLWEMEEDEQRPEHAYIHVYEQGPNWSGKTTIYALRLRAWCKSRNYVGQNVLITRATHSFFEVIMAHLIAQISPISFRDLHLLERLHPDDECYPTFTFVSGTLTDF